MTVFGGKLGKNAPNMAFFEHFRKNSSPKKLNGPKNSTIFQAKTQRTGSNSSHMNFKTHFIFSTFAVNEQKVLLFAQSVPKNAILGALLTDFPQKQ